MRKVGNDIWPVIRPNILKTAALLTLGAALLLSLNSLEAQEVITVPEDFETIQAAIDAAEDGDTIVVQPGTYFENIDFQGKAIAVESEEGPGQTIIDGGGAGSVVTFTSGEGPDSILEGFTVQNGNASFEGGGITIQNSSPSIIDNIITNNTSCSGGAGIAVGFGSPIIEGNVITHNRQSSCSGGSGGGINIRGQSAAQIRDNTIANNAASNGGGIGLFAAGTPTLEGNTIIENTASDQGGGIYIANFSDALIVQNLIIENSEREGGGIWWLVPSGKRGPLLVNNTIANNDSTTGSGIYADGYDAGTELVNNIILASPEQTAVFCGDFNDQNAPIFRFNNVFSDQGTVYGGICVDQTGSNGNISSDPSFVNPPGGDYHLQSGSPAIDAGDDTSPDLPDADFDGDDRVLDGDGDGEAVVDMGIDEHESSGSPVATLTASPTLTATPTMNRTPTSVATVTPTPMVTLTPTAPATATNTPTPSPSPSPPMTRTPTPLATATGTPTISLTPTATPDSSGIPSGRNNLTVKVFIDYRCDGIAQDGVDILLKDMPVTLTFSNGSGIVRRTTEIGLVNFAGFDASGGVTVSADLSGSHRGYKLRNCANSRPTVQLRRSDFERFGYSFVQFAAEIVGEIASP